MKAVFNDSAKAFVKYGVSTAGVVGIFTDVLTPLAKIGVWCFIIFTLLAVCIFFIGKTKPSLFDNRDDALKALWYVPLSLCMLLIAISTLIIYQINEAGQKQNGILSEKSEFVRGLQADLGLLKDINEKLTVIEQQNQKIVSNTQAIKDSTDKISANNDEIKNNTQATSDLLINKTFNEYDFLKTLSDANIERLKLYLSPQHWSSTYLYPKMNNQLFFIFTLLESKEPQGKITNVN